MLFGLFLTLSFLFVQWSILVGLVFFRMHKTIYLHWRNQREKACLALETESCKAECLQSPWDSIPGATGLSDFQGH